jgi:integrase
MVKAERLDGDRYRVRVYAGQDHLGKQHQRTRTFRAKNQREANKLAAEHEAALRRDMRERKDRGKTLNGLIDEWCQIRDANDSPSTVRKRQGMIRRIRAALGPIRLDDLSARHVDRWMTEMRTAVDRAGERVYSDTTIANHWSCLRAILRQGERWDLATSRPTAKARPPRRVSNRRPAPPTRAAAAVLIATAPADLRIAALIGAQAGLRRGEVMALRWSDIAPGVIHVRRASVDVGGGEHVSKLPKSGRTRDVLIGAALTAALAEHHAGLERRAADLGARLAPAAAVLPNLAVDPTGRTARPLGWLTLAWSRHAERQGAPDIRFHDLRHFYATEAFAAGVSMAVVQDQLGHTLLSTTQNIYTHAEQTAAEAAVAALDERWADDFTDELGSGA